MSGVIHCFTGGPAEAEAYLERGFYLSFSGICTFGKSAQPIREAAMITPTDRLLIETDAPYLAPVPMRANGTNLRISFIPRRHWPIFVASPSKRWQKPPLPTPGGSLAYQPQSGTSLFPEPRGEENQHITALCVVLDIDTYARLYIPLSTARPSFVR